MTAICLGCVLYFGPPGQYSAFTATRDKNQTNTAKNILLERRYIW